MYALSNISWKEYKEKTDWKHKPASHNRLVKLLLDIDEIFTIDYADSIFIWDCDFSKFEVELRGCICDQTIGGQWVSHEVEMPFKLTKEAVAVVRMTCSIETEDNTIFNFHDISVHHSVLQLPVNDLVFKTVLQEIYILKLEKTFRKQSKEYKELELKNKHVKEFFRSILGGE